MRRACAFDLPTLLACEGVWLGAAACATSLTLVGSTCMDGTTRSRTEHQKVECIALPCCYLKTCSAPGHKSTLGVGAERFLPLVTAMRLLRPPSVSSPRTQRRAAPHPTSSPIVGDGVVSTAMCSSVP
jgi:hypothetical protein